MVPAWRPWYPLFYCRKPTARLSTHGYDINPDRPNFDDIFTADVCIMGGHLVGGHRAWLRHYELSQRSQQSLLDCGLADDDQTILVMNYVADPNNYQLYRVDMEAKRWFWFFIFQDYNIIPDTASPHVQP